jgi:aspartokinase-like uncharacterized kinase
VIAIVKLGGSLIAGNALRSWLDALKELGGRVVVVAGGGPFADAVRATQKTHGFSEDAAHHMALLAMEQFAVMLADLEPMLAPFSTQEEADEILSAGGVPVWLPTLMALEADDLPASWDVTSDSLAAWLAGRLGARDLVLVKSADTSNLSEDPADWAASGLVDKAFPGIAAAADCTPICLGPEDHRNLAAALGIE